MVAGSPSGRESVSQLLECNPLIVTVNDRLPPSKAPRLRPAPPASRSRDDLADVISLLDDRGVPC